MDSIFAKAVLRSAVATRHRKDAMLRFRLSMTKFKEAMLCAPEASEEVKAAT